MMGGVAVVARFDSTPNSSLTRGGRGRSAQLFRRGTLVFVFVLVVVVAVVLVDRVVAVVVVLTFAFGLGMGEADVAGVDMARRGLDNLAVGGDCFLSLWLAGVSLVVEAGTALSVADSGEEEGLLDRNRNNGFRGESLDPRFTSVLLLSSGKEDDGGWAKGGSSVE